jgi:hypothetical protein
MRWRGNHELWRKILLPLMTFVVVVVVLRFLGSLGFFVACGLVVVAAGIYAGLQNRRAMKRDRTSS